MEVVKPCSIKSEAICMLSIKGGKYTVQGINLNSLVASFMYSDSLRKFKNYFLSMEWMTIKPWAFRCISRPVLKEALRVLM